MDYDRTSSLVKKLQQIVLANLNNEQFGVEDLAKSYGLSRSQLHKKLKKQVGKSVSQFIREVRLEEAKKLLEQEDITASEVAYQVGFSSATYFNTRFKDYFSYPPGEVRLRMNYERRNIENTVKQYNERDGLVKSNRPKWLLWGIGIGALLIAGVFLFMTSYRPEQSPGNQHQALTMVDSISMEKTVAVLPLKNWSGDPDLEYISDGMTDAIIIKLAKIGSIERVVPFTSIKAYKNTAKSIKDIANELDVKNILQGSFQLAGEQVSVKLQMIDGDSEVQFWESEFKSKWKTDEIFDLQVLVAENVAEKMNAEVSFEEKIAIGQVPTDNKEAYQLYLQASYKFHSISKNEITQAIPLYEKAIMLDSTFIEAYLGLAVINLLSGAVWGIVPQDQAWSNTKRTYVKALEMDASNKNMHQELIKKQLLEGKVMYEWDIATYEKEYRNSPSFGYAIKMGRHLEAFRMAKHALEEFPDRGYSYLGVASALFFLDRHKEAIDLLSKNEDLFIGDYFFLFESAKYFHYLGEQERSKRQLERFKDLFKDRPPIIHWLDAIHAEMEGNTELMNATLATLEDLYEQNASGSPAWFLALYYCHVKDYDKAFEWLQKSYDHHEVEMTWLKEEPVLIPLKEDPRYRDLYEKVGFSVLEKSLEKGTILP